MKCKDIIMEDFTNYKLPCMFIITPNCSFKCCKEAGNDICQNMDIVKQPTMDLSVKGVIRKYMDNPISRSVVFGGLEPFDTFEDIIEFLDEFRKQSSDPVVIYTGFNKNEVEDKVEQLKAYKNIIIKFGRFIPNEESHYDPILGIELASDNQYAEKIS